MPIHLTAPAHNPKGPDGQGWNRMEVGSLAGDQCALRPRNYATLWESQDTRRARYGGFGPCVNGGDCTNCPILKTPPKHLDAFDDQILVRIHPHDGHIYLMNRPEDGWASLGLRWTWAEIARLDGWRIGRRHNDEHSEGFWIHRGTPD
jgi:hypothetical protein